MSELLERVDSLQNSLSKMLHRHQLLQQKHKQLVGELEGVSAERDKLVKLLNQLDLKYGSLKAANAMLGSKEFKTETKLKINALIREIDTCIAHLAE